MENQRTEIIPTEHKRSEMTPKVFLSELSNILTTIDTETANVGKPLKKKAERIKRKFYKRIQPYLLTILMAFNYSPHLDNPAFENIESAQMQLDKNGITDEQRKTYIRGVSELLQRGIPPYISFDHPLTKLVPEFIHNVLYGRGSEEFTKFIHSTPQDDPEYFDRLPNIEDAWNLYLGLPQKHNTFSISKHQPTLSIEDKYYYKYNYFLDDFVDAEISLRIIKPSVGVVKELEKNPIKFILKQIEEVTSERDFDQLIGVSPNLISQPQSFLMGQYTLDKGQDEKGYYISYYDKWTLTPEVVSVGKFFEIYDRIYYNPQTFEIIENQIIPQNNANQTK